MIGKRVDSFANRKANKALDVYKPLNMKPKTTTAQTPLFVMDIEINKCNFPSYIH